MSAFACPPRYAHHSVAHFRSGRTPEPGPRRLARRETKDGHCVKALPRFQFGRGKVRMMGGIGEVLRFQTQSIATLVRDTRLAFNGAVEEIPAVKLNARLIGENTHDPSGGRFIDLRCFSQFPAS